MGREQFSASEPSESEKDRKAVLNAQYAIFGGFIGALVGSIFQGAGTYIQIGALAALAASPFLTNRYWERIYPRLP